MKRWLTTAQGAEELQVAPDKILDLIHSGQLKAVNIAVKSFGRPRWRISREDFDAFLAGRSSQAPTPPKRQRAAPSGTTITFYK